MPTHTTQPTGCACAHNTDGSVTTLLCPAHADQDPCSTSASVTGRRRTGSIVRGTCSACGWSQPTSPFEVIAEGTYDPETDEVEIRPTQAFRDSLPRPFGRPEHAPDLPWA